MNDVEAAPPEDFRAALRHLIVAMVVAAVGVFAVGYLLREPIEELSSWFVRDFGLVGVFVGTAILDTFPGTMHEPLLLFGYSGGLKLVPLWLAASFGSVLSGVFGFAIGRALQRFEWMRRLIVRYRIKALLDRYGVVAMIVLVISPVPYSLATWSAGAAGVPFPHLLLGSLFRIPKILLFTLIVAGGWNAGG